MRFVLVTVLLLVVAATALACEDVGDQDEPFDAGRPTTTDVPPAGPDDALGPGTTAAVPRPNIGEPVNEHGTAIPADAQFTMDLHDFFFEPTYVQLAPSKAVTVLLSNEGTVAHTFTVGPLEVDEVLEPGQTTEVSLVLPEESPVVFRCRFHAERGMRGAFFFSA